MPAGQAQRFVRWLCVPPELSLCLPADTTDFLRNRFWAAFIDIGLSTPPRTRVKNLRWAAIRNPNNESLRPIRAGVNEVPVADQGDRPFHREFQFGFDLMIGAARQVGEQLMEDENPSLICREAADSLALVRESSADHFDAEFLGKSIMKNQDKIRTNPRLPVSPQISHGLAGYVVCRRQPTEKVHSDVPGNHVGRSCCFNNWSEVIGPYRLPMLQSFKGIHCTFGKQFLRSVLAPVAKPFAVT
jgi:hypothetical protein